MASLRLGDAAPDFAQHASAGDIHFLPIIAGADRKVSELYDLIHSNASAGHRRPGFSFATR